MADIQLTINGIAYDCIPRQEPVPERVPIAFSQRNPHWAAIRLGVSRYTIGSAGCAVTAVAMLGTLAEPMLTPGELTTRLNEIGGFTTGGLLNWNMCADVVYGLEFVNYHKWRGGPADISRVENALTRGPAVLQVDFKPATSALDTHFVLGLAMTEDYDDILVLDPWSGNRGTLLGFYSQPGWDLARAVYALAEFRVTR